MSAYESLSCRFGPFFAEVARGERAREAGRHLPFAAFELLRAEGIGRITLPRSSGGEGANQQDALRLLMDLAAADANIAHLLRSHLVFVQHVLTQPDERVRSHWMERIAGGDLAGSAISERGGAALGENSTTVWADGEGSLRISGSKYYTTGTIFATWTLVEATLVPEVRRRRRTRSTRQLHGRHQPEAALAVVRVRQPRVRVKDDWDGFGQRMTGTGTMDMDDAGVSDLLEPADPRGVVPSHHKATLLALLAGISRAALRDGVELMRSRTRVFNTGGGLTPRQDDQMLGIIGELSAQQVAVEELVRAAGRELDESAGNERTGDKAAGEEAARETAGDGGATRQAALSVHRAQVLVPRLVLDVCTRVFDTLGGSATSTEVQLDRHWRNARTVASHDPAAHMARMVGDWEVNGTPPVPLLGIGEA